MSEDLPLEPDIPVKHVKRPIGISAVTFFKLCARAPTMTSLCLPGFLRVFGMGRDFLPESHGPVTDVSLSP